MHQYKLEQEINWAQRAHQNWIALGYKSTKVFQLYNNLKKKTGYITIMLDIEMAYNHIDFDFIRK